MELVIVVVMLLALGVGLGWVQARRGSAAVEVRAAELAAAQATELAARQAGEIAALRTAFQEELHQLGQRFSSDAAILSQRLDQRLEGIDSRMSQTHATNNDLARHIFETLGDVKTATTAVADQAKEFASLQDLL